MTLPQNAEAALALLISCSLKATVPLGLAWFAANAARRQSAAFRHALWCAGIFSCLALPLLALIVPAWPSVTLTSVSGWWGPVHSGAADLGSPQLPSIWVAAVAASPLLYKLRALALLVWAIGFLLLAMRLAAGLARLAWISARTRPLLDPAWIQATLHGMDRLKIVRPVRLRQCPGPATMPLTWGLLRPVLLLPSVALGWSEQRRRIVISAF